MVKMWRLKADKSTPDDWRAIFQEYQIQALHVVYAHPEGAVSRSVWISVNTLLQPGGSISRASIINFLNDCVDNDILDFEEQTGKGGYHRVYKPRMTWSEFEDLVIWRFIEKLMLIFPEHEDLKKRAEALKVQA